MPTNLSNTNIVWYLQDESEDNDSEDVDDEEAAFLKAAAEVVGAEEVSCAD